MRYLEFRNQLFHGVESNRNRELDLQSMAMWAYSQVYSLPALSNFLIVSFSSKWVATAMKTEWCQTRVQLGEQFSFQRSKSQILPRLSLVRVDLDSLHLHRLVREFKALSALRRAKTALLRSPVKRPLPIVARICQHRSSLQSPGTSLLSPRP